MKRFVWFALILAWISVPAMASGNSQTVMFPVALTVGSVQLPAGEYKVSWSGTGATVQVTISKKGVTPVTLPAKRIDQKHDHSGVTTNALGGANILQVIELSKVSLVLADSQAPGQ